MKRRGVGHGFWRLDAARAAQEQAQANGQNADAENEDGEMDLRKREFPLFLPDVDVELGLSVAPVVPSQGTGRTNFT
jgi:hypothetical protein